MGMAYGTHDRSAANAWAYVEKLGWSNWKAINTATVANAEALGVVKQVGSLQAGMIADLAAFSGDPAIHIRDMDQASTVVQSGRILKLNNTVLV
jgi:imidazolonepropionase-like amidohydrolase